MGGEGRVGQCKGGKRKGKVVLVQRGEGQIRRKGGWISREAREKGVVRTD